MSSENKRDGTGSGGSGGLAIVLAAALVIALVALLATIHGQLNPGSAQLALLHWGVTALLGFGAFIVLLMTMVWVVERFAALNLTSASSAFALPDGSVRSVIALALIFLFALFGGFMFTNVTRENTAGTELAKQIITILGTLVTAVSSFYFGSSTANSSANAAVARTQPMDGPPQPKSFDPADIKVEDKASITIKGSQLNNVNRVVLTAQDDGRTTITLEATSTDLSAVAQISAGTVPAGRWAITVVDKAGRAASVPGEFTVT